MSDTGSTTIGRRSFLFTGEPLGPARKAEAFAANAGRPRERGHRTCGPVKALADNQVARTFRYAAEAYKPAEAAVLKVALSFCAGARASEIAKLSMRDVTDAEGRIGDVVRFPKHAAKMGREREVPMDPLLRDALLAYRKRFPGVEHLATAKSSGEPQSPSAVTAWLKTRVNRHGSAHCASHSGRKTFITNLARATARAGGTLRDVQALAGHARLNTTQAYIALSPSQVELVAAASPARLLAVPQEEIADA
jgi:integrase/recombinase XerD